MHARVVLTTASRPRQLVIYSRCEPTAARRSAASGALTAAAVGPVDQICLAGRPA